MRKIIKLMVITFLTVGIMLAALSFISADSLAISNTSFDAHICGFDGTWQPDGCYGEPLNCYGGHHN